MGEARGRSGELSAWRVCDGGDIVDLFVFGASGIGVVNYVSCEPEFSP